MDAAWGIGINERLHRYLQNSFDPLLLQQRYDTSHYNEVLLEDVEVVWNFAQHNNDVVPHYYRFVAMHCDIIFIDDRTFLSTGTTLMNVARKETNTLLPRDFIVRDLCTNHRTIVPTQIDPVIVFVEFEVNHFRCKTRGYARI